MPSKDSSVEKLKKSLYVRDMEPQEKPRRELHDDDQYDVANSWEEEQETATPPSPQETVPEDPAYILKELHEGHIPGDTNKKTSILDDKQFSAEAVRKIEEKPVTSRIIKAVFISSFLFFLLTIGLAGYFLMVGKNQVSCENVDILVTGPRTIASGKKLMLDVAVVNRNPVPMRNAVIEVRFPEGTRSVESSSVALPSTKEQIGTIEKDERVRTTASALLFGQEQTDHEITAVLTYEIDDSNASFSCAQPLTVLISTSPVSLTVEGLEEISSGQEVELEITMTSNSEEVVPDLRLVAKYPFGFEFVSSTPEPMEGNTVWEVGDLAPGMERTVKLHGIVRGQGTEARTIGFSVGEMDKANVEGLATVLQKIDHPLMVTRPFLSLTLELDKNTAPQITSTLGKPISGVLYWENTLADALYDVEIEAHLNGAMLNLGSVGGSGFFRSIDKTIIWTPQTNSNFRMIEAGETGRVSFDFMTKPFEDDTSVSNPEMKIDFSIRARRISDNIPVPQNLQEQSKRSILFDTDLAFKAYAVYGVGPFTNTGPHPPKVDEQTTYTIMWEVTNSTNDVNGATLVGELPLYVNWLHTVTPNTESVTYNPVTREVIWSLGKVERSTGNQVATRQISFQVATIPSISQLKEDINIVNELVLQGVDTFTKNTLTSKQVLINTRLVNDPYFSSIGGTVSD